MMKKQDHLFQLIKSLNKEEKRHFKLYVNKYSSLKENNYLRLFNAIDKQAVYDEPAIKKQFNGETFIKQLTVTKSYLQKQIIKSLQNLHYDDTVGLSMLVLHHQIAILFKKGHYEICRELVKKGIEVCAKNELFLEWIGFLKRELDLINKTNLAAYKTSLTKYLEKTSQLLVWYDITTQGNHLANQLQIFLLDTPTFGSYNSQYQNLILKIESLISTIEIESLPLKTRFNLFFPLAQSYLTIADYPKAFDTYSQIYHDLKNEFKKKELHEQYISTLTGLIYASVAVNKPDMAKTAMENLKLVPEINHHIGFRKAESLAFYPLFTCALAGDFYSGHTAIEIVEAFLNTYRAKIIPAQYLYAYYYSAYIYLGTGNAALALKYLRKTDPYHKKELLPNLQLAIRIMEIIIFFDQHKFDLMESRFRSLQRQYSKEENAKEFLITVIKHFPKLLAFEPLKQNITGLYQDFLIELQQLEFNEQRLMFIHFDLISWLQSKIEGCSFGDKLRINAVRLFASQSGE